MLTKQEYTKQAIDEIKTKHPKDEWQALIQASKTVANTMDDPAVIPCHIEPNDADLDQAKAILIRADNYITRYLRLAPTVGLAEKQPRDANDVIIKDAPARLQKVICDGIPYACMIAFIAEDGDLKIGWSKRIDTKNFVDTQELNTIFTGVLEGNVTDNYQPSFESFCDKLVQFMSCQQLKETEVPFSKAAGRQAAVLRGLKDSFTINGKSVISDSSGPIPSDVAKNLMWFVDHVEEAYGILASNVKGRPAPTTADSVAMRGMS